MIRRWDVIAVLCNQHGLCIGAEIGVAEGRFTAALLSLCPDVRLWAIDNWSPGYKTWMGTEWDGETQRANRSAFMEMRIREGFSPRLIVFEAASLDAAKEIHDGSFDFVFIDADHSYEAVKADIAAWRQKIRPEGWVTGHDYDPLRFPGVVRAVEESFADFTLGDDSVWMAQV